MIDQKAFEWLNQNQLSYDIWDKKYRYNNESFDEWLDRVTNYNNTYKKLILNKNFIPGGRILANRGLAKHGIKTTYSNCYVLSVEDSIESIYKCCSDMARTYSYGGGVGIDISTLRPKGATVHNSAKETTGAVSFMKTFDTVTSTIGQQGRRGALMISLDVCHPDIEEFINIKANTDQITSANISVRVNDEFMKAVENDEDYFLRWPCDCEIDDLKLVSNTSYNTLFVTAAKNNIPKNIYCKRIKAKELFTKLVKNNWNYAEPGILYWDRINKWNMMEKASDFKYAGLNPCAEEPLVAGGACLLGSLNIASYISDAGYFNEPQFINDVKLATKFLNDVLDEGVSLHPLKIQQEMARKWKAIGLGMMDLAGALIKKKIVYGSQEAQQFSEHITHLMLINSFIASCDLNPENIPFEGLFNSDFYQQKILPFLPEEYVNWYPRNSQLLTIAPTGTISTMIQASSGGAEPVFALQYTRTTKSLHGEDKDYLVNIPLFDQYQKLHNSNLNQDIPDYFITAGNLSYLKRIEMQASLQQNIDASISSTVNLNQNTTVEDVFNLYMYAWRQGLKGITIYRDNCARQAILSTSKKESIANATIQFDTIKPVTRKELGKKLEGISYKCKNACGGLYIQLNNTKDNKIVEVFANPTSGGGCQANLQALARSVSDELRSGIKVDTVIESLSKVQCQACLRAKAKGEELDGNSCAHILAQCLKDRYNELNHTEMNDNTPEGIECPECHKKHVRKESGCMTCPDCGWSKCN